MYMCIYIYIYIYTHIKVALFAPWVAALFLAAVALRSLRRWPRKTIDIGWLDLLSALWSFAAPEAGGREVLEEDIARRWTSAGDAFVCLSVRSGLDLALSVLALPEDSEVLFLPGITIPAMVEVVEAHGLRAIGVDPPSTRELMVKDLEPYIGERTRMIVVTHLFGTVFDVASLVREARRRGLLVVEDCAQSFLGTMPGGFPGSDWYHGFRGHDEADISFVSFGLMKTLTALGGAVGQVRDPQLREGPQGAEKESI